MQAAQLIKDEFTQVLALALLQIKTRLHPTRFVHRCSTTARTVSLCGVSGAEGLANGGVFLSAAFIDPDEQIAQQLHTTRFVNTLHDLRVCIGRHIHKSNGHKLAPNNGRLQSIIKIIFYNRLPNI